MAQGNSPATTQKPFGESAGGEPKMDWLIDGEERFVPPGKPVGVPQPTTKAKDHLPDNGLD